MIKSFKFLFWIFKTELQMGLILRYIFAGSWTFVISFEYDSGSPARSYQFAIIAAKTKH